MRNGKSSTNRDSESCHADDIPDEGAFFRDLETPSQPSSTKGNAFIFTNFQSNQHKHSKRNAKS